MDFSTPWAPTLYGNNLLPCAIVADLVANDERPSFRRPDEKPWSVAAISAEVGSAGPAKAAILESVLAIWRLKMMQEEGAEDREWQNHLTAWLVRDARSSRREFS